MSIDREKLARALYQMDPIEDWAMDIVEWDELHGYRDAMITKADRLATRIEAGEFV
jgi:hypothetical protein